MRAQHIEFTSEKIGLSMKEALKNIADIRTGHQVRGRLEHNPAGSHRIILLRHVNGDGLAPPETFTRFSPRKVLPHHFAVPGMVLLKARGDVYTACCVHSAPDDALVSSYYYMLTPHNSRIQPAYLAWYLNTAPVQAYLRSSVQGTNTPLLPKAAVESLMLEIPPTAVQDRISRLAALRRRERRLQMELDAKRDTLIQALCLEAARNGTMKGPA